jgi:hypothetical protein
MKRKVFRMTAAVAVAATLMTVATACGDGRGEPAVVRINIDFDGVREIDIRDSTMVRAFTPEVTDRSLLAEIKDVALTDGKVLVYTNDQVVAFDGEGRFLFTIDRRGHGPGEYVHTSSFFVRGDSIFLYDEVSRKLLAYDGKGAFLADFCTEASVSALQPLGDGTYVAKNTYRGENNSTPAICFLDGNLVKTGEANNRFLTSGNYGFDNFYPSDEEILYWEFLNDTIFAINGQRTVYPKYFVDFNDYAIPRHIRDGSDEYELLDYLNNDGKAGLATAVKYVSEDAESIRFIFIRKEAILNYVRYDKGDGKAAVFRITDSWGRTTPQLFMKYGHGEIILSALDVNDVDANPQLFFVDEKRLQ